MTAHPKLVNGTPLPHTVKVCCKAQLALRNIDYGGNGPGAPSKRRRTAVGATRIGLGSELTPWVGQEL